MSDSSFKTTSHDAIRIWVEDRGGKPASVADTSSGDDPGVLRIDFPGHGDDEGLEALGWDEFFEKFDAETLAFLYQIRTDDGELSRFSKFVARD